MASFKILSLTILYKSQFRSSLNIFYTLFASFKICSFRKVIYLFSSYYLYRWCYSYILGNTRFKYQVFAPQYHNYRNFWNLFALASPWGKRIKYKIIPVLEHLMSPSIYQHHSINKHLNKIYFKHASIANWDTNCMRYRVFQIPLHILLKSAFRRELVSRSKKNKV